MENVRSNTTNDTHEVSAAQTSKINDAKDQNGFDKSADQNNTNPKKSTWVQFDDDGKDSTVPAILNTETVQISIERSHDFPASEVTLPPVKNVDNTFTARPAFSNGEVVVTLLPVNTKWPWITAARFRPELVPEELMAQGLTLTVEEYVHAMELLVNDVRFSLYNICYKRVLVCWITLAFIVLLALLFSGLTGLTLFSLGVAWLLLNAAAIFLCMWLKLQLARGLELCLARVNKLLMRHKLLMALDDRGKISCHKVNLCFIYFDCGPCIEHLQQFIEREEGASIPQGWERRLDITANDIIIQGGQTTRLSRRQGLAEQTFLRYLQRWGKDFLRRRLDWTLDEDGGNPVAPRHQPQALCPCQYTEELLQNKPHNDKRACFPLCNNWLRRRGLD